MLYNSDYMLYICHFHNWFMVNMVARLVCTRFWGVVQFHNGRNRLERLEKSGQF